MQKKKAFAIIEHTEENVLVFCGKAFLFSRSAKFFRKDFHFLFFIQFYLQGGICIIILPLILAVAAFMDFKYEKVPNLLIVSGFGCGIFVRVLQGNLWESDAFLGLLRTGGIWARLRYLWEYLRLLAVNVRLGNTALPDYHRENARGGERVHFAVALFVGGIVTMGGYI